MHNETRNTDRGEAMKEGTPLGWEHPNVDEYSDKIKLKIPGYYELHEATAHLLKAYSAKERKQQLSILLVGAGGGQELLTLGRHFPDAQFTAVDSSERMLELARKRLAGSGTEGLAERVEWVCGTVEELGNQARFDAAACLLVPHFVIGHEAKRRLFQQMASLLLPGAPLFAASLNGEPEAPVFQWQMRAWIAYMETVGVPLSERQFFEQAVRSSYHVIPFGEVKGLMEQCGFHGTETYFGSFLIDGWASLRA